MTTFEMCKDFQLLYKLKGEEAAKLPQEEANTGSPKMASKTV